MLFAYLFLHQCRLFSGKLGTIGCCIRRYVPVSLHDARASGRPKTDIVFMKNGDKITCEIKSLEKRATNRQTRLQQRKRACPRLDELTISKAHRTSSLAIRPE